MSTCLLLPPGIETAIGTAGAAVTAVSCTGEKPIGSFRSAETDSLTKRAAPDSLKLLLTAERPVKSLDLLIYDQTWTRSLMWYGRFESMPQNPLAIPAAGSDLIAVAVANSPAPLNPSALQSYDSAELLQMRYADEDPLWPLMSAVAAVSDSAALHLLPLLCEVQVLSISNSLPGSPFAENIHIYLRKISASAEVLRFDGFRPTETVDDPAEVRHPSIMEFYLHQPIGIYTVYPGIKLYCYPSYYPEVPGCPRPEIVLECTVEGERLLYTCPLPPAGRAETVKVEVDIAQF